MEKLFQATLNQLSTPIWLINKELELLFANLAASPLLVSQNNLTCPESAEPQSWRVIYQRVLSGESIEFVDVFSNEQKYLVKASLINSEALLIELTAIEEDTSVSSEYTLINHILEVLPTPIFVKDDQHRWIMLNQAFAEFMSHPKEALLGKSDCDFFPKEEADIFWEKDNEVFTNRKINDNEESFTDATGTQHWILTRKAVFNNPEGRAILVGIITDFTERRQVEETLRKSEALLEAFFSSSLTGFFLMMLDIPIVWNDTIDKEAVLDYVFEHQRITKVNQSMLDQYQLTESEFLGLTPNDFFAHELETGRKIWTQFFDSGSLHIETNERKADGSQMFVEGSYNCLYDDQGRIIGHCGIQKDVTDRHRQEQALRKEKERVEAANHAKNDFLAKMSHELRTPLNAVLGFSAWLRGNHTSNLNQKERLFVERIHRNGMHLLEMINDLLDLSRIESGHLKIEISDVSLSTILKELSDTFAIEAEKKGLTFKTNLSTLHEEAVFPTDPERLRQIISNLLQNAIKFTDQGFVQLSLNPNPSTEKAYIITVLDTGSGIPLERQEQIFTPFYQIDSSVRRTHGGAGLGLAIVKHLCELLHCKLSLKSQTNQGSCFSLSLLPQPDTSQWS